MSSHLPRAAVVVGLAGALAAAAPASAQVVQSLQLGTGLFMPAGESGRVGGDVLVTDLDSLVFKISSFKAAEVNGEWTVGFGNHIEVGVGIGYQARTVPSFYAAVDQQGVPIRQNLRLRIVPVTAIVRFLPLGKPGQVQPYVGIGAAALRWRYSESGDFVDADSNIFRASFVGTGTAPGLVVAVGVRMPIKGDVFGLSVEGRYQSAIGRNLPQPDFLSDRIDLSGTSLNVMFLIRY